MIPHIGLGARQMATQFPQCQIAWQGLVVGQAEGRAQLGGGVGGGRGERAR